MKKITFLLLMFVGLFINQLSAQTSNGDTLIISHDDAMNLPVNEIIAGDTTAAGERIHKVYQLEPNGWYPFSAELAPITYDLNLVGGKRTSPDQFRPILLFSQDNEGWSLINAGQDVTLKGLHIMEVAETEGGALGPWARAGLNVWPAGENQTIILHDMILDFSHSMWLAGAKNGLKLDISNTLVRFRGSINNDWWNGFAFVPNQIDNIEVNVENTTFYQGHFIAFNLGETTQNSLKINNCTFVDNTHHLFVGKEWMNAEFTNNLFVNAFTNGETAALRGDGRDADVPYGIINMDTMYFEIIEVNDTTFINGDPLMEQEAERVVKVLNNNNYVHPDIKEFWDFATNYDGSDDIPEDTIYYYDEYMATDPDFHDGLMNFRAQGMFENDEAYPYLEIENTTSLDPGFVNYPDFSAEMIMWAKVMYGPEGHPDVREQNMPKIFQDPDGNVLVPTDPMIYDLKYTNPTLLTAATHGGPIGDLTWFIEDGYNNVDIAAGIADLNIGTNVSDDLQLPVVSVYPNPVKDDILNINGAQGKLKVLYNIAGQTVISTIEEQINVSDLSKGIYILKVENESHKIIIE